MADNNEITGNENSVCRDSIRIADDVIRCIAALAATDIDGVARMSGSPANEVMAMLGGKSLDKGVRMTMDDDDVKLVISIIVNYGSSIPAVCAKVQEKVRQTIENMTGYTVSEVVVNVSGIDTTEAAK